MDLQQQSDERLMQLVANDQREPLTLFFCARRQVDGVGTRRESHKRKALALQGREIAGPMFETRVRRAQRAAHRGTNRLPIKRIATRLAQQHARTERIQCSVDGQQNLAIGRE